MITLGITHLSLAIISFKILIPREIYQKDIIKLCKDIKNQLIFILIIFGVVIIHLLEVNLIDPVVTGWIGTDFAENIYNIENNIVFWFSQNWTPTLVYFFVFMYIAVYPFTLWFSPLYFIITNEKKSLKIFSYGLLIIYLVALPFYLFIPVTNVYTFFGVKSALETTIPTVEQFFYSTTTSNNCLPSLHVAMSILIVWSVKMTGNKKLTYFTFFSMVAVIISVIYLAIHWITDVLSGILLAISTIYILNHFTKEK